MEDIKLYGWLMVVIGLATRYVISRRRFYRRGIGGLQRFSSFERGVLVTAIEMVFRLYAILMFLGGILILGFYYSSRWFEKREKERKSQETEVIYNELKEGMLPLPHTSEQAA